jgi:hypothetical protein
MSSLIGPCQVFYVNVAKLPTDTSKRRVSQTLAPNIDTEQWQINRRSSTGTKKVVSKRENELRTFLYACLEGNFPELGLILATLVLDFKNAEILLDQHKELFGPWQEALLKTKNHIYLHFLNKLNESMKSKS